MGKDRLTCETIIELMGLVTRLPDEPTPSLAGGLIGSLPEGLLSGKPFVLAGDLLLMIGSAGERDGLLMPSASGELHVVAPEACTGLGWEWSLKGGAWARMGVI